MHGSHIRTERTGHLVWPWSHGPWGSFRAIGLSAGGCQPRSVARAARYLPSERGTDVEPKTRCLRGWKKYTGRGRGPVGRAEPEAHRRGAAAGELRHRPVQGKEPLHHLRAPMRGEDETLRWEKIWVGHRSCCICSRLWFVGQQMKQCSNCPAHIQRITVRCRRGGH